MGDLCLKFLRRQTAAVCLCQRNAVFVHIVAVSALDLRDVVTACGHKTDHIDPENVLHPAAGDGAAVRLGQRVQLVDHGRRRRPGIDGLLAGRDHVDAAGHALLDCFVDIADEAAGRDDGDVGVALVEDLLGIVRDDDARLDAKSDPVADVLADGRTVTDAADDLRAMLIGIAEGVLAHLSAAVLHDFDFIHDDNSFQFLAIRCPEALGRIRFLVLLHKAADIADEHLRCPFAAEHIALDRQIIAAGVAPFGVAVVIVVVLAGTVYVPYLFNGLLGIQPQLVHHAVELELRVAADEDADAVRIIC